MLSFKAIFSYLQVSIRKGAIPHLNIAKLWHTLKGIDLFKYISLSKSLLKVLYVLNLLFPTLTVLLKLFSQVDIVSFVKWAFASSRTAPLLHSCLPLSNVQVHYYQTFSVLDDTNVYSLWVLIHVYANRLYLYRPYLHTGIFAYMDIPRPYIHTDRFTYTGYTYIDHTYIHIDSPT